MIFLELSLIYFKKLAMKYSIYLFLVSSGMIASTSLGFADPTEKNLDSSTSYNGNTASSSFTPLTTSDSNGTQYICTGDVCIMYAGTASSGTTNTALSTSCFQESLIKIYLYLDFLYFHVLRVLQGLRGMEQ